MTTSPEYASPNRPADVLSVRSPSALLASVPYLVGFTPTMSLVVLMLAAPRSRVVMTVRVDLPTSDGELAAVALVSELVPRLSQVGADAAIAVVYTDVPDDTDTGSRWAHPHCNLMVELDRELDLQGIRLNDAILVAAGRRWSYLCDLPDCCPVDGVPIEDDEAQAVRARLVWQGLAPASSRDEVVARVQSDEIAQQLVRDQIAAIPVDDREPRRPKALYALLDLVLEEANALQFRGAGEPDGSDSDGSDAWEATDEDRHLHIAQLLVALKSIATRDLVLRHLVLVWARRRGARPLMDALCAVMRCAPASYIAPIATVTALLSWQAGDGLIAMEAVTRALADDPDYSMAKLAYTAIDAGLPPQTLVAMFDQISEEECMTGRVSASPPQETRY